MTAAARAVALVLAVGTIGACGGDAGELATVDREPSQGFPDTETAGARELPAARGREPSYFVPGESGRPLAIVGRARLAVSGKPVELSADVGGEAPIGPAICINPAYRGRGELGIYIPATCFATPLKTLMVARVQVPEQAVRGYELVIWGVTAGAGADVTVRFLGTDAEAAVFDVDASLLHRVGAHQQFSVFVVELPSEAACKSITVEARGVGSRVTDQIQRKSKICRTGGRA